MASKRTNSPKETAPSTAKAGKAAIAAQASRGIAKGRLVRNHSTNLPGLIAILERLCHQPGIDTLTPAVIGRARSHAPQFRLKVSVPIKGGFKLIARQGKSFQEVFVTTHLEKADLEAAILASL